MSCHVAAGLVGLVPSQAWRDLSGRVLSSWSYRVQPHRVAAGPDIVQSRPRPVLACRYASSPVQLVSSGLVGSHRVHVRSRLVIHVGLVVAGLVLSLPCWTRLVRSCQVASRWSCHDRIAAWLGVARLVGLVQFWSCPVPSRLVTLVLSSRVPSSRRLVLSRLVGHVLTVFPLRRLASTRACSATTASIGDTALLRPRGFGSCAGAADRRPFSSRNQTSSLRVSRS